MEKGERKYLDWLSFFGLKIKWVKSCNVFYALFCLSLELGRLNYIYTHAAKAAKRNADVFDVRFSMILCVAISYQAPDWFQSPLYLQRNGHMMCHDALKVIIWNHWDGKHAITQSKSDETNSIIISTLYLFLQGIKVTVGCTLKPTKNKN